MLPLYITNITDGCIVGKQILSIKNFGPRPLARSCMCDVKFSVEEVICCKNFLSLWSSNYLSGVKDLRHMGEATGTYWRLDILHDRAIRLSVKLGLGNYYKVTKCGSHGLSVGANGLFMS